MWTVPVNEGVAIESYKWKYSQFEHYMANFENEVCRDKLNCLLSNITNETLGGDGICKLFYDFIETAINGCFGKKKQVKIIVNSLTIPGLMTAKF